MKRRFSLWVLRAVGCLLAFGWIGTPMSQPSLVGAVHAEDTRHNAESQTQETVAQLRARIDQLEKELEAVRRAGIFAGLSPFQPTTGKPDSQELEPLRQLVEARLLAWRRVHAAFMTGNRGGSAGDEARARTLLYVALARLAWAEREDKAALEHIGHAATSADRMVSAEQAGYEQGTLTLDVILEAQALRAEINMALLRMGGKLPEAKAREEGPWVLPPGEMPKPYPNENHP